MGLTGMQVVDYPVPTDLKEPSMEAGQLVAHQGIFWPSRPDWDTYFLDIADAVAARADCRRRQHGAVIVKNNRIVSTGYNGAPAGEKGCLAGHCPRGLLSYDELKTMSSYDTGPGRCISIHAEQNALLYSSRQDHEGGIIYITGEPCPTCRRLIGGSGLAYIRWRDGDILVNWHVASYSG